MPTMNMMAATLLLSTLMFCIMEIGGALDSLWGMCSHCLCSRYHEKPSLASWAPAAQHALSNTFLPLRHCALQRCNM